MCKETTIKAILCKPDELAKPVEIENNLKSLQEAVGGCIQCIYPFNDEAAIICNDDGKLVGLSLNRGLYDKSGSLYDIIAGDFLIVGLSDSDFDSLSPELISKYLEQFKNPEIFFRLNGKIIGIKEEVSA